VRDIRDQDVQGVNSLRKLGPLLARRERSATSPAIAGCA